MTVAVPGTPSDELEHGRHLARSGAAATCVALGGKVTKSIGSKQPHTVLPAHAAPAPVLGVVGET